MSHRGLLLVNLGTPDDPKPDAVGRYLREFLMDENVIDVPSILRWPLVNLIIAPKRKFDSSEAYESIWTDRGSPLLFHSLDLKEGVQERLHEANVELGMRYGNPSIRRALERLRDKGVQELSVIPLYPHYAMSSTQTVLKKIQKELNQLGWDPKVRHLPQFYNHPKYIEVLANNYRKIVEEGFEPDFCLMSYHGLPGRHLTKLNKGCLAENCCADPSERSATCYRYQAFQTSKLLAEALELSAGRFETSFQSRLGPGWIEPFTDLRIEELARDGIKKLAVFSPSFVADCLESLEEIQIRGQESFRAAGGEELRLVPSLNSDPLWVQAVANMYHGEENWKLGL